MEEKISDILTNVTEYHKSFYRRKSGASLYFYRKALTQPLNKKCLKRKLEYIYATVALWGMDESGKNRPKMVDFKAFKKSITGKCISEIKKAKKYNILNMEEKEWKVIEYIFKNIKIMKSKSSLVGNSKAMHQLLPNIIPPIDRTYTLGFLEKSVGKTKERQWGLMRDIIVNFFREIIMIKEFKENAVKWKKNKNFACDLNKMKIIDNLIIGRKRLVT